MRTTASSLEPLEARIAPASTLALVNPNTATYTDADGDHVTVHFSKPLLTAANLTSVLAATTVGQGDELKTILLTEPNHTDITVSVKAAPGGDGLATVGSIVANGDLGTVKIHGDLVKIFAGTNGDSDVAVKVLDVQSLGLYAFTNGNNPVSNIKGQLGALKVATDVGGGALVLVGGGTNGTNGRIGSIFIGGALKDQADISSSGGGIGSVHIGKIFGDGILSSVGDIGRVVVPGGIVVAPAQTDAAIESTDGGIASVTIGGTSTGFAPVQAKHDIGRVKLTGAFHGAIVSTAGSVGPVTVAGSLPGSIEAAVNVGAVNIRGDLTGSVVSDSGRIASTHVGGSIVNGSVFAHSTGPITVTHDIVFDGPGAGELIGVLNTLDSLSVGGSVTSTGVNLPIVAASQLNQLNIGHDLVGAIIDNIGGKAMNANIGGSIEKGGGLKSNVDLGTVNVGGSLSGSLLVDTGAIASVRIGGTVSDTSIIQAKTSIGTVKIGHSFSGASLIKAMTGSIGAVRVGDSISEVSTIEAATDLLSLSVGQSIAGSTVKADTGKISSVNVGGAIVNGTLVAAQTDIGTVKVGGDIELSKFVAISGDIGTLAIGGTMRLDTLVSSFGNLGTAMIGGDIESSTIKSLNGTISSVKVGGSLAPGALVNADLNLDAVSVHGDVNAASITSNFGNLGTIQIDGSLVAGGSIQCPGNIESVTIGGSVDRSLIFAMGATGVPLTIKSVTVHGNWIASSLSAGVKDTNGNGFGNSDDTLVANSSTIASIVIGGAIIGNTPPTSAHFGFVAQEIISFKLGGLALPLQSGSGNDVIQLSPITGDVTIREVA